MGGINKFGVKGILIVLLHMAGFIWASYSGLYLTKDSEEYLKAGFNLLAHGIPYSGDWQDQLIPEMITRRPILYPLFLLITGACHFGPYLALAIQNILCWLTFIKITRFLEVRIVDKIKSFIPLLWIGYPSLIIYSNMIMAESLSLFLLTFFSISLINSLEKHRLKDLQLATLFLVLLIFTKPAFVFISILFVLPSIIVSKKIRRPGLLAFGFLPLLGVLIWGSLNFYLTGVFHFSSIEKTNLLNYNTRILLEQKYGLEKADSMISQIDSIGNSYTEYKTRNAYILKECKNIIFDNLPSYIIIHLKGMVNFFLDPGRFDIASFTGYQNDIATGFYKAFSKSGYKGIINQINMSNLAGLILPITLLLINLLIALGFLTGLFYGLRFGNIWVLVLSLIILYVAFITGPVGASRFRVPVYPILICISAFGYSRLIPTKGRDYSYF